jgi:tRNA 2-selenouridine synthase
MIQKVRVEEFVSLAAQFPVLDVRSPGEYGHAHIPGAISMPLFTDEERKVVGTAYKQQSREAAIKIGLDYFGGKMRRIVEEAEAILEQANKQSKGREAGGSKTILVHCWRGGMRSAGIAWLLDLYGFKVYTLVGGYKAFRNYVLDLFGKEYRINIIGGYTGSGKTKVLKALQKKGQVVIDLEGLAHHKGSAFGDLGEDKQPTQEMFENLLAVQLSKTIPGDTIWMEDESMRIGTVMPAKTLWSTMRNSPVFFLEVPFEERLNYITEEYGKFKKDGLVNATIRVQKRLGSLNTKNAINYFIENNLTEAFRILLTYYDKSYSYGLHERENLKDLLRVIPCETTEEKTNAAHILTAYSNAGNIAQ